MKPDLLLSVHGRLLAPAVVMTSCFARQIERKWKNGKTKAKTDIKLFINSHLCRQGD